MTLHRYRTGKRKMPPHIRTALRELDRKDKDVTRAILDSLGKD